ncbi:MAG: hypothetical protein KAT71_01705 [Gammaproteobacteria bacterium]|nr:hypothetical protein [Gammaproteobacteria bacterium]
MPGGKRRKSDPNGQWRQAVGGAYNRHNDLFRKQAQKKQLRAGPPPVEQPYNVAAWEDFWPALPGEHAHYGRFNLRINGRASKKALFLGLLFVGQATAAELMQEPVMDVGGNLFVPQGAGTHGLVTINPENPEYGDVGFSVDSYGSNLLNELSPMGQAFYQCFMQGLGLHERGLFSEAIVLYQEFLNKGPDEKQQAYIYALLGCAQFQLDKNLLHSHPSLKQANSMVPLGQLQISKDAALMFANMTTILYTEYLPAYLSFLETHPSEADYPRTIFLASTVGADFAPITAQAFREFIEAEGIELAADHMLTKCVINIKSGVYATFLAEEIALLDAESDYEDRGMHREALETLTRLLNQLRNPLKRAFVYIQLGVRSVALNDYFLGYHYFAKAETILPLPELHFDADEEEPSSALLLSEISREYVNRVIGLYLEFLAKNPSEREYYTTVLTTDGTTADWVRRYIQEEGIELPDASNQAVDAPIRPFPGDQALVDSDSQFMVVTTDSSDKYFIMQPRTGEPIYFTIEESAVLNSALFMLSDEAVEGWYERSFNNLERLFDSVDDPRKRAVILANMGLIATGINQQQEALLIYRYLSAANNIAPLSDLYNPGNRALEVFDVAIEVVEQWREYYGKILSRHASMAPETMLYSSGGMTIAAGEFVEFAESVGLKLPEPSFSLTDHFTKGRVATALGVGVVGTLGYFANKKWNARQERRRAREAQQNTKRDTILRRLTRITESAFNAGAWRAEVRRDGVMEFVLAFAKHNGFEIQPGVVRYDVINRALRAAFGGMILIEGEIARIVVPKDMDRVVVNAGAGNGFARIIFEASSAYVQEQRRLAEEQAARKKTSVIGKIGDRKEAIRMLLGQLNDALGSLTGVNTTFTGLGGVMNAADNVTIAGARGLHTRELTIVNAGLPGLPPESRDLADLQREQGEWERDHLNPLARDIPGRVEALNALMEKLTRQGTELRATKKQEVQEEQRRQREEAAQAELEQAAIAAKSIEVQEKLGELKEKYDALYVKVDAAKAKASMHLEHENKYVRDYANTVVELCGLFPSTASVTEAQVKREVVCGGCLTMAKFNRLLLLINKELKGLTEPEPGNMAARIAALEAKVKELDNEEHNFAEYKRLQGQLVESGKVLHPAESPAPAGPPRPTANGGKGKGRAVANGDRQLPYDADNIRIFTVMGDMLNRILYDLLPRFPKKSEQITFNNFNQAYRYALAYTLIRVCRFMRQELLEDAAFRELKSVFYEVSNIVLHNFPSVSYEEIYACCGVIERYRKCFLKVLGSGAVDVRDAVAALKSTDLYKNHSQEKLVRDIPGELRELLTFYCELLNNQDLLIFLDFDRDYCFAGIFTLIGEGMQHQPDYHRKLKEFLSYCQRQVRDPAAHPGNPADIQEPADTDLFKQYIDHKSALAEALMQQIRGTPQPASCPATLFSARKAAKPPAASASAVAGSGVRRARSSLLPSNGSV